MTEESLFEVTEDGSQTCEHENFFAQERRKIELLTRGVRKDRLENRYSTFITKGYGLDINGRRGILATEDQTSLKAQFACSN